MATTGVATTFDARAIDARRTSSGRRARAGRWLAALAMTLFALAATAQPANDDIANAEVIASLPFVDVETAIDDATTAASDPPILCRSGAGNSGIDTVWYRYTAGASPEYVTWTTATSNYNTLIALYTGTPGNLRLVSGGCNDDGIPSVFTSRIVGVRLDPGTTYYFVASRSTNVALQATLNLRVEASPRYVVTTSVDSADGTCDAHCSLREAISASNATPGVILVPAGNYALSILGDPTENANASGDLDVLASTAIYGAGRDATIIDGQDLTRVMQTDPTNTSRVGIVLGDLTLAHGRMMDGDPLAARGGGIAFGGTAMATLDGVAIRDNTAFLSGGGIWTNGRLLVRRALITGNSVLGYGGGLATANAVNIDCDIEDTAFVGNVSLGTGAFGGGAIHANATVRLVNSTLSGNRANSVGGAIHVIGGAHLGAYNVTIAGNLSDADADGGVGDGGGVRLEGNGGATFRNSIIADNAVGLPQGGIDCATSGASAITSSYSLLEGITGFASCAFVGTGDVMGVDPALAPLADDGGPTPTQAPGPGPARDGGDPDGCKDRFGELLANDQRGPGFPRIAFGTCDRGAYEVQPPELVLRDGFEG